MDNPAPTNPSPPQNPTTNPLPSPASPNPTPNVQHLSEPPHRTKWIIGIILLIGLLIIILAAVAIKVYDIKLPTLPQAALEATPDITSTPQPSFSPSTEKSLKEDPLTQEAFNNVKKIINDADLDNPALNNLSVTYSYLGTITRLQKTSSVLTEVTTGSVAVPGLPNTWAYTKSTGTHTLPTFDKIDSNQLKRGDKVAMLVAFDLGGKSPNIKPNEFRLVSIHLLDKSLPLPKATASNPPTNPIDLSSTSKQNAVKLLDLVNIDSKSISFAALLYNYSGKITEIKEVSDGNYELTTDSQISPFPNKWQYNDKTNIFLGSDSVKDSMSNLKVGSDVSIAAVLPITPDDSTVISLSQNKYNLVSITLLTGQP